MIINKNTTLRAFTGEIIVDSETKKEMTLGQILCNTLAFRKMSKDPYAEYMLGQRIAEAKEEVNLTAEEISLLKEAIKSNVVLSTIVSGQIIAILEQNIKPKVENGTDK